MALFRTLPTPTNDLLPSLMMEICLVLAPDVNFFLNSRKQGLPCWRSLSFFLSLLTVWTCVDYTGYPAVTTVLIIIAWCTTWERAIGPFWSTITYNCIDPYLRPSSAQVVLFVLRD